MVEGGITVDATFRLAGLDPHKYKVDPFLMISLVGQISKIVHSLVYFKGLPAFHCCIIITALSQECE